MSPIFLSVINTVLTCYIVNGAKILAIFPIPAISHQIAARPFTQELADRGHEVTVITAIPAFPRGEAPKNLKEIDIHNHSFTLWDELLFSIPTVGKSSAFTTLKTGYKSVIPLFENQMKHDEVQELLNDENKTFDLLIIEACVRATLAFSHKFKVPLIVFSSFGTFHGLTETISGPFHPVLHADMYQHRIHDLSKWETLKALWVQYKLQNIVTELEEAETAAGGRAVGSPVPLISELSNNVDLVFLNIRVAWDNFRPAPPSLVHLGGLLEKRDKELPKDLKSYLDSSSNGVIYVSFGTNVLISQIPEDKREVLIKAFSKLPYDILLKWDSEKIQEQPKNLKLGKWFPQYNLLQHRNIKLFITQGGLHSTDEAVLAGVPLVGIPMISDQWYNVDQYKKFGIGTGLDIETLTEESLLEAINKVIGDESYRRNIARFRAVVQDMPQSALDRAMWWTEYLLRHGGKHLRSPAANMSIAQYLELELLCLLLIFVFVVIFLVRLIVYKIINIQITDKNKRL